VTRRATAATSLILLFVLVAADFVYSRPNPYKQPAIIALGSGSASTGGFCGALPD